MAEKVKVKVLYDKENDIISLFKEESRSKFSFELELPQGDIVFDYDFNGKIVGLEFFNASSYFPPLKDISSSSEIQASMSVQYGANWAQVSYIINFTNLQKQVVSFINAPYSRKLILEN